MLLSRATLFALVLAHPLKSTTTTAVTAEQSTVLGRRAALAFHHSCHRLQSTRKIATRRIGHTGSITLPIAHHRSSFSKRSMATELIDVDCNLWHRDLKTLQTSTKKNSEETDGRNDDNFWNMLTEDAVSEVNIVAMLSPSSTISEAQRGIQALEDNTPPLSVKTTVGVHPYHVDDEEFASSSLEENGVKIKEMLQSKAVFCSAVGECGLDASEGFPPMENQIPWFELQVKIAQELNLPLFVHERLAFDECCKILDGVTVPIIIHCFTGTKDQCVEYIKRGYSISVSGYILKDTNDNCAEVISCLKEGIIPLDKLMIETDAPYMGFENCRQNYATYNEAYVSTLNSKKRKRLLQSMYPNVPSSLPFVLDKVVECLQDHQPSLTGEQVAEYTTNNARKFFNL